VAREKAGRKKHGRTLYEMTYKSTTDRLQPGKGQICGWWPKRVEISLCCIYYLHLGEHSEHWRRFCFRSFRPSFVPSFVPSVYS